MYNFQLYHKISYTAFLVPKVQVYKIGLENVLGLTLSSLNLNHILGIKESYYTLYKNKCLLDHRSNFGYILLQERFLITSSDSRIIASVEGYIVFVATLVVYATT